MNTTLPLTEARNNFPKLVDAASKTFARFVITRKGKPEAVLMSREEYEALVDTLEILSSRDSIASLRRAKKDIRAGKVRPLKDIISELKL